MNTIVPLPAEIPEREQIKFEFYIKKTDFCWMWTGGADDSGYGKYNLKLGVNKYRKVQASRMAYHLYKGEIPLGFTIDHLCNVRRCVNPEHLEAVPHAENIARSVDRRWLHLRSSEPEWNCPHHKGEWLHDGCWQCKRDFAITQAPENRLSPR